MPLFWSRLVLTLIALSKPKKIIFRVGWLHIYQNFELSRFLILLCTRIDIFSSLDLKKLSAIGSAQDKLRNSSQA
jgi:hypothetical protein